MPGTISMCAIIRMGMIMYLAGTVIDEMGYDNEQNSRNQQPVMVLEKELL